MVWPSKLAARVHAWRRTGTPVALDPALAYGIVHRRLPRVGASVTLPETVTAALERYRRPADDGAPLEVATEAAAAATLAAAAPLDVMNGVGKLLELWVARGGAAFAVRALLAAGEADLVPSLFEVGEVGHYHFMSGFVGPWRRLRELLTGVDDGAYADARRAALALRSTAGEVARCALAYAFPLETGWARDDALGLRGPVYSQSLQQHHRVALVSSLDDLDALRSLVEADPALLSLAFTNDHVITAFDRRPERVAELAAIFGRRVHRNHKLELAELLGAVGGPAAARVLVELLGADAAVTKAARHALDADPKAAVGPLAEAVVASPKRARHILPALVGIAERHPRLLAEVADALDPATRAVIGPWIGEGFLLPAPPGRAAKKSGAKGGPPPWRAVAFAQGLALREGGAMSPSALEALFAALSRARPSSVPRAVADALGACDPASVVAFAGALLDAWTAARAPAEDAWVLGAFAALGGPDAARRLGALARSWGKSELAMQTKRAVELALDALSDLGTDAALVELEKLTRVASDVDQAAEARIDAVLARRGLDREDLADRVVPTCGLVASSSTSTVLDFGARAFTVVVDDALKPGLVDATGARLTTLPRPTKADDPAKAEAARDVWNEIKETLRDTLHRESKRLELAMLTRRRWTPASFRDVIVAHPVLGRLAQRVVWASYAETSPRTFRVAEDGSLADVQDVAWAATSDGPIGIPHPLDLAPTERDAWSGVLNDYRVAQPFAQLGRAVHRIRDDERRDDRVRRLEGTRLPKQAPYVLEAKGWEREDGGLLFARTLPASETVAEIHLDEDDSGAGGYRVARVEIEKGRLGDLDPVAFSELVLDVERASL